MTPGCWLWLLFLASSVSSAPVLNSTVAASLERAWDRVRAGRSDIAIRADRWDTAFKLPAVEGILTDPLRAPEDLADWSQSLAEAKSLSGMIRLGARLSSVPAEITTEAAATPAPALVMPSTAAARAITGIVQAMSEAQALIVHSAAALSPEERDLTRETISAMLRNEYYGRGQAAAFAAAARFDQGAMTRAAQLVAGAVERALPVLKDEAGRMRGFPRTRWKLPMGDLLVGGPGDDLYAAADLEGVVLLVDFGGNNTYSAAPAAAGDGQQRIVVDLGAEVRVAADSSTAAAGSGIFGLGLLYLPNPEGSKIIQAADFSLGAGLFGVGGLYLRGTHNRLHGGRFTCGAGAFGLGLLDSEGDAADFTADLAGQGFAFTRGAGLFAHRGGAARWTCGLRYPDGREASATISLCQGTGYGPRAFAAGGVGLASLQGDGAKLRSGYFAQGSGYWHGLGALFVSGRGNSWQSRRYCQGAGVHTAVGALVIDGNGNRSRTWGVGPGFGWDYGVGLFLGGGDGNSFGAEWASGRGDTNGQGLVFFQGHDNRLALADIGTGALRRGAPSYGVAVIDGADNRYRPAEPNPWGWVQGAGLAADEQLSPGPAQWPAVDRESALRQDRERLQGRLREARDLPLARRLEAWLAILADGGLDQGTPMETAAALLSLAPEEGAALAGLLSPERFDEFIWLRVFLPAFGRSAAQAVLREIQAGGPSLRRALLVGVLGSSRAADGVPAAAAALKDPDWRVRRAGANALGTLFDREEGEEPGRWRFLEACADQTGVARETDVLARIGARYEWDLLSVLALDEGSPAADRVRILQQSGNPFDRMAAGTAGIKEFLRILRQRSEPYGVAIRKELAESARLESASREALLGALRVPEREVLQAAVLALGQIGRNEDAPRVAVCLRHDTALVREAAAAALGKMGAAASEEIRRVLHAGDDRTRALAALAAAQSGSAEVLGLLAEAFQDRDPEVRRTAIAALSVIQAPLRPHRKDFLEQLRRLAAQDPVAEVRFAAGQTAAIVARE